MRLLFSRAFIISMGTGLPFQGLFFFLFSFLQLAPSTIPTTLAAHTPTDFPDPSWHPWAVQTTPAFGEGAPGGHFRSPQEDLPVSSDLLQSSRVDPWLSLVGASAFASPYVPSRGQPRRQRSPSRSRRDGRLRSRAKDRSHRQPPEIDEGVGGELHAREFLPTGLNTVERKGQHPSSLSFSLPPSHHRREQKKKKKAMDGAALLSKRGGDVKRKTSHLDQSLKVDDAAEDSEGATLAVDVNGTNGAYEEGEFSAFSFSSSSFSRGDAFRAKEKKKKETGFPTVVLQKPSRRDFGTIAFILTSSVLLHALVGAARRAREARWQAFLEELPQLSRSHTPELNGIRERLVAAMKERRKVEKGGWRSLLSWIKSRDSSSSSHSIDDDVDQDGYIEKEIVPSTYLHMRVYGNQSEAGGDMKDQKIPLEGDPKVSERKSQGFFVRAIHGGGRYEKESREKEERGGSGKLSVGGIDRAVVEAEILRNKIPKDAKFIYPFLGIFRDMKDRITYIIYPKSEGSLLDLAQESPDDVNISIAAAEMVYALKTLHESGYVHRDIQLRNFLVDQKGHLGLWNFKHAVAKNTRVDHEVYAFRKNASNQAPEVSHPEEGHESSRGVYTEKSDIYSLGVAFRELVATVGGPDTNAATRYLTNLSDQMMAKNPQDRPSLDTILQHGLFSHVDFVNLGKLTPALNHVQPKAS